MPDRIKIEGEVQEIRAVWSGSSTYLPMITLDDGTEWYVAEDSEHAGDEARKYWRDMAENDPREFSCIVGEETLIAWALGHSASPGSVGCCSLEEWLDLTATVPEEHWAGYDHCEREITRVGRLSEEIGFTPTVAYRHN